MINRFSIVIKKYLASYSGLTIPCWQRIALGFIHDISTGVCFFLSLYFVDSLKLDITTAGLIVSLYGLGTAIGGYFGGKLSDIILPDIISITCLIIKAIALISLIFLKSINALIFNCLIIGICTYGFTTSNYASVLNYCHKINAEKSKAINILYSATNMGFGMAAILISAVTYIGFKNIFVLSGILLAITAIYLSLQLNNTIYATQLSKNTNEPSNQAKSDHSPNKQKILWLILGCVFFISLVIVQITATYSIYLKTIFPEMGMKGVSLIYLLNPVIIIFFQTPFGNAVKKANKILLTGLGGFLIGLGMFILNFPFSFLIAIFSCIILTFGEMLFMPMAQLVCYEHGAMKKKGTSLGIFKTVYALSAVVGPAIGSYVYQHIGSKPLWLICGAIGLSCFIACLYCHKYD